ncbi:MAG TPA: VOC family protein [Gammaproteobacteria bacterium]|nr:VOC family protein [Gammaproteobacteria bacterium]
MARPKATKKKTKAVKKVVKKSVKKPAKKMAAKTKQRKVSPVPKDYHAITPYLIVDDPAAAVAFYKKAFGAKSVLSMEHGGKIMHAELKIGDSKVMLSGACSEKGMQHPKKQDGCSFVVHLYIKKVDDVVKAAVKAGAELVRPVADMFYGDRSGMITDPFGHCWCVSTHIEDLTKAQVRKRAQACY